MPNTQAPNTPKGQRPGIVSGQKPGSSGHWMVAFLACWLPLDPAVADQVLLRNGDRLSGEVLRHDSARLKIKTAYIGVVEIDSALVREVMLDETARVLLDDETVLAVTAVTHEEDRVTLHRPAAQPVTIDPARIKVVKPEPWELDEGYRFGGLANFALKAQQGNNDKNEIDLDFKLDYRRRWHRLQSWGQLEYDTRSGEKTTDKWSLDNNYRRLFNSPWYASGWLYFKHDRFQDLKLRSLLGPALGYTFDESSTRNLRAEVGVFVIHDDFYDGVDDQYWGPGWNLEYDQRIWHQRLQPYHRQYGVVAADGSGKNLWRSWTGVRVPLVEGIVGSLEYEVEYESKPPFKTETTDTTLRVKLGYAW